MYFMGILTGGTGPEHISDNSRHNKTVRGIHSSQTAINALLAGVIGLASWVGYKRAHDVFHQIRNVLPANNEVSETVPDAALAQEARAMLMKLKTLISQFSVEIEQAASQEELSTLLR